MKKAIEKLTEALSIIATEQAGMEGENLTLSLKTIKAVVKAIETMAKMEPEKNEVEAVENVVENVVAPQVEVVENVEKAEAEDAEAVVEIKEEKPVKWVFSKAVKTETFDKMCEKAWADSGLKEESIKQKVRDEIAKWYKMSSKSPWAGIPKYDKYRPHSKKELEKRMYECFHFQFCKYDGYKGNN